MEKKNVVEGDVSNNAIVNIGDTTNITNLILSSDQTDEIKVRLTKALFRNLYSKDLFEIPNNYITRSLTHLKAIQDAKRWYYPDIEYRPILDLLTERKRIVLLGDAGTGKSIELRYIFNLLYKSNENIFPIYISLKDHILDGYLDDRFSYLDAISPKNIYFIVDGYNEISELKQPKFNRQIDNLISRRKGVNILISSRKNTYDINSDTSTSYLSNFEIYYLNELTLYDVERYFLSLSNVASFEEFNNELIRVKLIELATNPFYIKS